MSRMKSSALFAGFLEVQASAPLDGRTVTGLKADLTDSAEYEYSYEGLDAYAKDNKRKYVLTGEDATNPDNWKPLAFLDDVTGGGSGGGSVDLTGYAKLTDLPVVPTDVSAFNNDSGYQDATQVNDAIDMKLQGYQPAITVDTELSATSENPVQNKVIKDALDSITAAAGNYDYLFSWDAQTHDLVLNAGTDDEQKLKLSNIAFPGNIPDVSGFAKSADLATVATSGDYNDLENKPSAYDDSALVARVSALEQSSGNVDLTDYYTKGETDAIVSTIKGMELKPVPTLPTQDVRDDVIYLVKDSLVDGDLYSEYVYVDGAWEKFGTARIDLSNYYTKDEVDTAIANVDTSSSAAQDADIEAIIDDVFGNGGGDPGGGDPGFDPNEP